VCLNPGTTDPTNPSSELACNTDSGQGGGIDESSVWSAGNLTISPTAGIYGQPVGQTTGPMAMGKVRFLNLDQCNYANTTVHYTSWVPVSNNGGSFSAGSNVSSSAATSPTCGGGAGTFVLATTNSAADPLDLLAHKFVNLEQCEYGNGSQLYSTAVANTSNSGGAFDTGTNSSNQAASPPPTCGSGAGGYILEPVNSGVAALDLLDNRYANLDECDYHNTTFNYAGLVDTANNNGAFDTGTSASDTPQTTLSCGPGAGGFTEIPSNSGFLSLDTLDASRGQGFVQFEMTAPQVNASTTEQQNGGLTGSGTGDPTTSGSIIIAATGGASMADPWIAACAVGGVGLVAALVIRGRGRRSRRVGL
jgi:hypothetical protein